MFFRNLDNWSSVKVEYQLYLVIYPLFPLFIIGLQNPYLVLMDFNVQGVQSHALSLGFDAISTYALPGGTKEVTYIILLYQSVYLSK